MSSAGAAGVVGISIHAPCTGSDENAERITRREAISIHAPCTGSDGRARVTTSAKVFDFNPRSLHGERPGRWIWHTSDFTISIHAPCTGSDAVVSEQPLDEKISIHAPCTGSDGIGKEKLRKISISIHAPCTGSDYFCRAGRGGSSYFNPRSLHGERLYGIEILEV